MHEFTPEVEALANSILEYSLERLKSDPPLDGPKSESELYSLVGETITEDGLGGQKVLELFKEVLAPACISTDHPRYLAFIPSAPTESANLFDLVVGASALYGGSWLEGAGAVFAENQALAWLANLAGLPSSAGGVFLQGGTIGNLSALVAARYRARQRNPQIKKWAVVTTQLAHSSISSACEIMDIECLKVDSEREISEVIANYRKNNLSADGGSGICAIVATAGSTNLGLIDDLTAIGKIANDNGIWFHVDGAYGLAGLVSKKTRPLFAGIELADSFIVDPHKWLFAPFDACALIYRNPADGKAAHTQKASYLDTLTESDEFNPSDYGVQLTRRARGLPFWFSLAAHGVKAYEEAIDHTMLIAKHAAELIKEHPNLELLLEPKLSIVAFKRKGWTKKDYEEWSEKLLADQIAFVTPSADQGEIILRFAIVNPWTQEKDIKLILDRL
jgi:L-2,4-diaminobutyrate decarboxylase